MPAHNEPNSDVTLIKDLKNGMRNFTLLVIVLEVSPRAVTSKEGIEVRPCKVADRTACINLIVPDNDVGCHLQPGDICRVTEGLVSNHEGLPTLYIGKGGQLLKTMEFMLIFSESLNMSEPSTAAVAQTAQQGPTPVGSAPQQVITSPVAPGPATVSLTTGRPVPPGGNNHTLGSAPAVKIE